MSWWVTAPGAPRSEFYARQSVEQERLQRTKVQEATAVEMSRHRPTRAQRRKYEDDEEV